MSVQERFIHYIYEHALCQSHERILLAVSGGKDSVLMTHLFAEAGYTIGIAHCNFRLRGEASDADEALTSDLARALEVPFYSTGFDTETYARQQGISIQMAARELRYAWFETIRSSQGYDYIAVAQHRNDHVETIMLNLVRGTGLAGLKGIKPKRDRIIRPLLFLNAEEIATYVAEHGLAYRDDASNFSTKYARNKIRIEVIPRLKELNPELERTMAKNMERFADAYSVVETYVAELRKDLFTERRPGEWHIPISGLAGLHPLPFLLYELFRPYGFTEAVISDIAGSMPGTPGKRFSSPSHMLYVDRHEWVVKPIEVPQNEVATIAYPGDGARWHEYHFESGLSTDMAVNRSTHVVQLDAAHVVFPIRIRAWEEGDVFRPLGMGGRKKLSDFFVSLKVPAYQKHFIPVVINGDGNILWVAPYRMDDRYKITDKTKKVVTLACSY
ncbi:tRNA lysidine(34) synthetase TilS [Parapedobacter sp. ISTM3]|uniref:tRNA(Ile)-lysidine synthase n=1 Tax=Parapedobacter luteus TaxID=623280 RepID=A0A1T5CES7_9SPHI|nr:MULTISPECIES: tRNA lysidine(34) synthetase TilS [Parapedobacter]MBK1438985.1 tRNA lysidine(34) synthetase TilS [Parapedobacter sp. ISTM3]SKB57841.1 tRNA(Ile)-lysidine synthase [Parapedobacter luteus]